MTIADNGSARVTLVVGENATPPETLAAQELAACLQKITGSTFTILTNANAPDSAIFVGPGVAARKCFPDSPMDKLGSEEFILRTEGQRLLLVGGRPRGTLYAVSRFLQEQCGVRWWTPWASRIPFQPSLQVANHMNIRFKPAFEYREPFWFDAEKADWAWRNCCNGQFSTLSPGQGGCIHYKGFVHTFYELVPPAQHFSAHPEWFSFIHGTRTNANGQLCLSNPQVRDFVVDRVKQWLHETPDANIISVSQNDFNVFCECPDCNKAAEQYGSEAGPMLRFVNYVAEKLETDFPNIDVDTLAYTWTRKPPRAPRPRPNVIVRLCSIEANFRQPLDSSSNSAFATDLHNWAKQADRLYVWDYVTDFSHYVLPFPNWFTLGPNLRFFLANHVRGVFEEGAYQSHGAEMAELRAWVLAQLLWNPAQNDRALIHEFLTGYYGAAARPIEDYMELLWNSSQRYNLTIWTPPDAPFLGFKTLARAEELWQQAEHAVTGDEELSARVRLGHLPVTYVWLANWNTLRQQCQAIGAKWPLDNSPRQAALEWRKIADGVPGKLWTKVTQLNEAGLTPDAFSSRFE